MALDSSQYKINGAAFYKFHIRSTGEKIISKWGTRGTNFETEHLAFRD